MLENINSLEDDVNCEALQVDEMADPDRHRISGPQSRMARAALEWSVEDLAANTGVSHVTIGRIERDDPKVRPAMHLSVRKAFEDAGIEFVDDNGIFDRRKERGIPIEPPADKKAGKGGLTKSRKSEDRE
jgi:DNA-binding XRE family transcriptional regulator